MKNTFLTICMITMSIFAFSQEGGIRLMKMKSAKIVFLDLAGNGDKLVGVDDNGNSKNISVDGNTLVLVNDTLRSSIPYSIQTLSGTNIVWNLSNGRDATLTLTGNTVITLINAVNGMSGTLWVTNATPIYTITFAGYINSIDTYIRLAPNMVITSGSSKSDDYTFKYNGYKMNWNGTLDRK